MKKQLLTTLGCLLVSAMISHAQDSAAPADTAAPTAATPETATPTEAPAVEAAPAEAAPAETPAAEAVPDAAPAVESVATTETETPVVEGDSAAASASTMDTTATASAGVVNDLIVIDDTPLLDAIRNLARTAGINMMIDPKVNYGQPGPDGRPIPQPTVSIRWEKISAEQALMALLNNYGLQAVTDPKINIVRITVKDPAAPDPLVTRTFQLQYAGPSNVIAAVTASLSDKRSKVVADVRTSQLVIVATEKEMVQVEKLLAELDTRTKQVLIEAKILETTVNPKTVKGIDWTGTLAAQRVSYGNNNQAGPVPDDSTLPPLSSEYPKLILENGKYNPATAFLNADGLAATLSFLNTQNDTKIVSEPRMVTLDNQKATIDVGLLFPVVQTTAGTANTTGGAEVNYTNLTVSLDVTPRIAANNFVELKVSQSILRLGPTFASVVGGEANEVNSFFSRQANTTVLIPSGNTLVLGGLISDENSSGNVKVPILGDLPVLGGLFRQDSKERNRNNLMLFITPSIVGDEDFQPAQTTFLQTKAASVGDEEWSAWDSGRPRDWSKKGVKGGATKNPW